MRWVLDSSLSGFYARRNRPVSPDAAGNQRLRMLMPACSPPSTSDNVRNNVKSDQQHENHKRVFPRTSISIKEKNKPTQSEQ